MSDERFERALHATLDEAAPNDVPAPLRARVRAVSAAPAPRSSWRAPSGGWARGVGLVAGVALAVVLAAVVVDGRWLLNPGGVGGPLTARPSANGGPPGATPST